MWILEMGNVKGGKGKKRYLVHLESIWKAEVQTFLQAAIAQTFSNVIFHHYFSVFTFLRKNVFIAIHDH